MPHYTLPSQLENRANMLCTWWKFTIICPFLEFCSILESELPPEVQGLEILRNVAEHSQCSLVSTFPACSTCIVPLMPSCGWSTFT